MPLKSTRLFTSTAQYYLALTSNEAQLRVSKTSFIPQILIYLAKSYWWVCTLPQRILHITVNQYKDELTLVYSGREILMQLPQELKLFLGVYAFRRVFYLKRVCIITKSTSWCEGYWSTAYHLIPDLHHFIKKKKKSQCVVGTLLHNLINQMQNCNV